MRRTGVALLSVVALTSAVTWWLSRVDAPASPPREEPTELPIAASPPKAVALPSPAPVPFRVDGEVLDAATRRPIAEAELVFESESGDRYVLTTPDGRFSLVERSGPQFLTTVRARGYVTINPDRAFDRSTSGVTLELKPLPVRRGRVVDTAGRPVEGALIQPYLTAEFAGRELESVLSDPGGEFQLVVDDTTRLAVSHLCCLSAYMPVGRPEDVLVITLQPAKYERVVFKGQVLDEDDQPVEGAKVSGVAQTSNFEITQSISVVSGVGGRFEVDVPSGAKINVSAVLGERDTGELTFGAQDVARLTLLEHASSFSGRVTNEDGQPVTRFTVSLLLGHTEEREFTPADGRFVFDALPKVRGTAIVVSAPGYLESPTELLRLGRGEQATGVDFVLRRGRTISGVVFDRDTRHPLAGANVSVTDLKAVRRGPNGRTRTDSLGRFVLGGLREGRVEVLVSRSGYLSRQEVLDTANQAEVRIGLTSSSSTNAKDEYVGVGMRFSNAKVDAGSGYFVGALHPQGGALVAGVLVGDEILAADGAQAGSVELADFLLRIKGAEGTMVTLTVRRDGKTFDVHAVRRTLSSW